MSSTAYLELQEELQESTSPMARAVNPGDCQVREISPQLFVDCLVEPAGWQRRQRRWTAVTSLVFQFLGMGILLLLPLMFTDSLPTQQLVTFLVAPPPPPPPPPPAPAVRSAPLKSAMAEIVSGRLVAPTTIPKAIKMIKENEAPPSEAYGVVGGVPGGVPGGQLGGVLGGIVSSANSRSVPLPPPVIAAPKRLRISEGVSVGQLIHKTQPEYPFIAKTARIQGEVVLTAVVGRDGSIQHLTVVSGPPLLIDAAIDAIKQWRYRPFLLNREPVEVETNITVTFSLSRDAGM
ncbi:MAG TPA: TonB family protein [Terriglobales bacterium]